MCLPFGCFPGSDGGRLMAGNSHVVGVIEDDASIRGALRRVFRSAGIEASLFATAEEYLEDPHRGDLHCLVIDVRLPGMSGLDLLEQVCAADRAGVMAVVITSHDDEQVRNRALAAGAIGFFLKPFDNRQLQAAVSQALGITNP